MVYDGSWLRLFVYTVYIFRDKTDEDKRTNTDSKRGFLGIVKKIKLPGT